MGSEDFSAKRRAFTQEPISSARNWRGDTQVPEGITSPFHAEQRKKNGQNKAACQVQGNLFVYFP